MGSNVSQTELILDIKIFYYKTNYVYGIVSLVSSVSSLKWQVLGQAIIYLDWVSFDVLSHISILYF